MYLITYDIFTQSKHIWPLSFQIIIPFPIFGAFQCRGRLAIRPWSYNCLNHLRLPVLQTRPEGYEVNIRLNEKNQNNIRINIYCISVFKGTNIHPYLKTTWMWLVSNACSIRISSTFEITFLAWFSTSLTNFQLGIDKFISPWIVTS